MVGGVKITVKSLPFKKKKFFQTLTKSVTAKFLKIFLPHFIALGVLLKNGSVRSVIRFVVGHLWGSEKIFSEKCYF